MAEILEWLIANVEWIFSGAGVALVLAIIHRSRNHSPQSPVQELVVKNTNASVIAVGDVHVHGDLRSSNIAGHTEPLESPDGAITLGDIDPMSMDKNYGDAFLRRRRLSKYLTRNLSGVDVSLAILDIDDLTIINNLYGRPVGDRVLELTARLIKGTINPIRFGRCGDDTFYVLLQCKIDLAQNSLNRLCQTIRKHNWAVIAQNLRVTCSIGVAERRPDEPFADWIMRASIGMTDAKTSGRDQALVGPEYLSRTESREFKDVFS